MNYLKLNTQNFTQATNALAWPMVTIRDVLWQKNTERAQAAAKLDAPAQSLNKGVI